VGGECNCLHVLKICVGCSKVNDRPQFHVLKFLPGPLRFLESWRSAGDDRNRLAEESARHGFRTTTTATSGKRTEFSLTDRVVKTQRCFPCVQARIAFGETSLREEHSFLTFWALRTKVGRTQVLPLSPSSKYHPNFKCQ
jgi:hypothetical protein